MIFYDVPARYMLQLQAEMKAYSCNELWFVCFMAVSETVTIVRYDETLWNKAWDVLINLYDNEKPTYQRNYMQVSKIYTCQFQNQRKSVASFYVKFQQ